VVSSRVYFKKDLILALEQKFENYFIKPETFEPRLELTQKNEETIKTSKRF